MKNSLSQNSWMVHQSLTSISIWIVWQTVPPNQRVRGDIRSRATFPCQFDRDMVAV